MRRLKLAALMLAALVMLAACGGSAPERAGGGAEEPADESAEGAGEPIKIGSIHPLTGALAYDGQQMANGVQLAVDHVNAEGGIESLDGTELEVLDADSQGEPETGQSEAQRLIDEGAVALVGPYQTAVATNIAAVAERGQVPFVIDVAVADSILEQGYGYTFRLQPNASTMGTEAARYLQQLAESSGTPVSTIAYLHEQTDFGTGVYEAFAAEAEALGMEVTAEVSYDAFAVADLTTEITQIAAAEADVIAVTGYYNDGVLAAEAVAAVQPDVQAVLGVADGAFDLTQFAQDAGAAAEGFLNTNYRFDATNEDMQALAEEYSSEFGDEMRTAAVLSYESVRSIATALEEAGSTDPTDLRDALAGLSMDSLLAFDGPVSFDDTGQNTNAIPVVTQVQDGAITTVFPEELAETEPRFPAPPGG